MALFYDGLPCTLCGEEMTNADQLFSTSHFLGPDSDLWEYSDAIMPWDCDARWEHQARFGQMYFEANRQCSDQNGPWGVAHSDDQLMVKTSPDKHVGEVDVMLARTGSGFRVCLADGEDWLTGECFGDYHHEIASEELTAILPLLRSRFQLRRLLSLRLAWI